MVVVDSLALLPEIMISRGSCWEKVGIVMSEESTLECLGGFRCSKFSKPRICMGL